MITIHNLEVRIDVEGDDDRETFARLFSEFIQQWSRAEEAEKRRENDAARERSLTDSAFGGSS